MTGLGNEDCKKVVSKDLSFWNTGPRMKRWKNGMREEQLCVETV